MTGPTMLTPKASICGAGASICSSRKMYCCTGVQPVPPYSTGQCGTAHPFLLRMRVQRIMSSLLACMPATSLSRISFGRFSLKKVRTSSRKAISSGVKLRSMFSLLVGCVVMICWFHAERHSGADAIFRRRVCSRRGELPRPVERPGSACGMHETDRSDFSTPCRAVDHRGVAIARKGPFQRECPTILQRISHFIV